MRGCRLGLTYNPAPNFNGQDSLQFRVSDGSLESEIAEVILNVLPVNDAPWAGSEEINSTEDEFIVLEFNYGDADNEEIEFNITKLCDIEFNFFIICISIIKFQYDEFIFGGIYFFRPCPWSIVNRKYIQDNFSDFTFQRTVGNSKL